MKQQQIPRNSANLRPRVLGVDWSLCCYSAVSYRCLYRRTSVLSLDSNWSILFVRVRQVRNFDWCKTTRRTRRKYVILTSRAVSNAAIINKLQMERKERRLQNWTLALHQPQCICVIISLLFSGLTGNVLKIYQSIAIDGLATTVLGDFNLDWLTNASEHLKELCSSLNILQLITDPTRPNPKNHNRSTLTDLILTNRSTKIIAISNHCPVACIRDTHLKKKTQPRITVKRNLKNFNEQTCIWSLP